MSKYVVSGYIGFDNFGDEAIAGVLSSHLKKNGAQKVTLISSNPKKTSKLYGVNSVGMLDFLQVVSDCDVLISGGGSLLQDVTSLKSLIYYLAIIMYGLAFNKKVIIFAQGFTPFRTKIGKLLTKFALKRCHKITVRDIKSQEFLKEMGISSELISDPVFAIETPKVEKHVGVGVQLRDFQGVDNKFLEKLADKLSDKFSNQEIKLLSLQESLDLEIIKNFSQKLNQRGLSYKIYNNLDVKEMTEELSKLEYLIGMRFHACLVSAKAGVKVLGINYDIKVKTLANNIGFPSLEINEENLSDKFDELLKLDVGNYKIPEFNFPEI